MKLRPAAQTDAALLYEWANDPVTRAGSFSTEPIPWATHVGWLKRVLADPGRRLWVSVTVAPCARGCRLATPIIAAACHEADGDVWAHIRPENDRSIRAFAAAGFVEVGRGDEVVMRWP